MPETTHLIPPHAYAITAIKNNPPPSIGSEIPDLASAAKFDNSFTGIAFLQFSIAHCSDYGRWLGDGGWIIDLLIIDSRNHDLKLMNLNSVLMLPSVLMVRFGRFVQNPKNFLSPPQPFGTK